jgi:SAM-dependent methyltransferase
MVAKPAAKSQIICRERKPIIVLNKVKKAKNILFRRVFSMFQEGDQSYCPCCGWKGRKFMMGNICPQCCSMARHRLMPYSIYYFGLNFNNSILLHIGTNINEFAFILNRFIPQKYYRLDILSKNFVNLIGDICNIPLEDGIVDYIVVWHVLEHIPDDRKAIHEMHRVLKVAVKLLISVPISPPDRKRTFEDPSVPDVKYEEVYGHHDHVRACGLDYYKRFEEKGFKVETLMVKNVVTADKKLFGLSESHVVWCMQK